MNKTVLRDPADTMILLLDPQNGLFQTVKDVPLAVGSSHARATIAQPGLNRRRQP